MADSQQLDFDTNPPMPVNEYEQTVKRVNVAYDLAFTLSYCILRALRKPDLNLLVVGAGGGMEIERFLPDNPGWRFTGVDPSQDMLALARTKADALGAGDRVTLIRGTVDDLPADSRFDAATCMYVLHFLPDEGKLTLLRGIVQHLTTGAPMLVASGGQIDAGGFEADLLGAWQEYGVLMGMPAERMAGIIQGILSRPIHTSEAAYVRLLGEAGFSQVATLLSVFGGAQALWLAR